jgi:hypothetical protein
LTDIIEEERLERLKLNIDRGNHLIHNIESVRKIEEFIDTELSHRFLLLIPKLKVIEIPGAEAYPIHIVK